MVPRFQKWKKKTISNFFPNFFQILSFWSAFYSKTAVFETNFSQKGLAGICSYLLHMWSRPSPSPPHAQIWCIFSSRGYLGKKDGVRAYMWQPDRAGKIFKFGDINCFSLGGLIVNKSHKIILFWLNTGCFSWIRCTYYVVTPCECGRGWSRDYDDDGGVSSNVEYRIAFFREQFPYVRLLPTRRLIILVGPC